MVNPDNKQIRTGTPTGNIFDIQRFSVNDGPGIRTTVFFKGCPLTCLWCDNPESQSAKPQLLHFESSCARCLRCVSACPNGANSVTAAGTIAINRDLCQGCGECVAVCHYSARSISGQMMTFDEVFETVKQDELFYRNSGGGVTASGGEPTRQPAFLYSLFERCQRLGYQTTLDTCGDVSWDVLQPILDVTNLVYFDLKQMDQGEHSRLTGVSNELILENAVRISDLGKPMVIRLPMIKGLNDSPGNIAAVSAFIRKLNIVRVDILPLHHLGKHKYERLGLCYALGDVPPHTEAEVEMLINNFNASGITVSVA